MQSHLRTCVRFGIGTGRIAQHYNERISATLNIKRLTNILLAIDTGKQCTISGFGKVYDEFMRTGVVKNYTGCGTIPATCDEEHFDEAPLRIMSFADTFGNMHNNYR